MGKQSISFTVSDGSKRAATWKCWTSTGKGKSDVYLACRELGGSLKISLHDSGNWRYAYTSDFADNNIDSLPNEKNRRLIKEWHRPDEVSPGITLAIRILTTYLSVNIPFNVKLNKSITKIPIPPEKRAREIDIIFSAPNAIISNWPYKNSMKSELVGSIELDNGEKVWIVHRVTEIPDFKNQTGKLHYYKGQNEHSLPESGIRAHLFKHEEDGSRTIVDCAIVKYDSHTFYASLK